MRSLNLAGVVLALAISTAAVPGDHRFALKVDAHQGDKTVTYRWPDTFRTEAECVEYARDDFTAITYVLLQAQIYANTGAEASLDNIRCVDVSEHD